MLLLLLFLFPCFLLEENQVCLYPILEQNPVICMYRRSRIGRTLLTVVIILNPHHSKIRELQRTIFFRILYFLCLKESVPIKCAMLYQTYLCRFSEFIQCICRHKKNKFISILGLSVSLSESNNRKTAEPIGPIFSWHLS